MNPQDHEPIIYWCHTITGQNRGSGLGFPTINLIIPDNFPFEYGIYGGLITLGDNTSKAAIHYGPIPSFNDPDKSLEAHVINAHIANRPEKVGIQLLAKIRDIKKFKSTKELRKQISLDIEEIKELLNE